MKTINSQLTEKQIAAAIRQASDDVLIAEYRRRIAKQEAAKKPPPVPARPAAGRSALLVTCPHCREQMGTQAAKLHEPHCRAAHLLRPGKRFTMRAGGRIVTVELVREGKRPGSWQAFNVETGRPIFVTSPRALREYIAAALFKGRQKVLTQQPLSSDIER